jgi:hypothetical protein
MPLPLVPVPNLIGLSGPDAKQLLTAIPLRFIWRFPFSATGVGLATAQSPAAGTQVPLYSIVTADFPSPLGPMPDAPEDGPSPNGWLDGTVEGVFVGQKAAVVRFSLDPSVPPFTFVLYRNEDVVDREGWMRRGAMLALAQRAFGGTHKTQLLVDADDLVTSIEIYR